MTAPDSPVRVLIVDDQALFREALATLLEVQPEIEVVGEAGDGEQAVRLCPPCPTPARARRSRSRTG